jgi:crotonobetainyl-CoA:carnitine CoA-transferase CaiB-like acyl-CoA transferase
MGIDSGILKAAFIVTLPFRQMYLCQAPCFGFAAGIKYEIARQMELNMSLPLLGITVLDLSRLLPGPLCTHWMREKGATVIKIEDTKGGDYLRYMPPHFPGAPHDLGAMFCALNAGKQSITLDLKEAKDRELFLEKAAHADVVVESFRPGVLDKLGVGYADLKKANPKIILCSISGYGQTGPLKDAAGHDIDYMARGGALGLWGPADGDVPVPGIQVADVAGGAMSAFSAVMMALFRRERTGEGAHLDISMTEGVLCFHYMSWAKGQATGKPLKRGAETLTGGVPCYGVYLCGDSKFVALGALEPKFWQSFCKAVQKPEWNDRGLEHGEKNLKMREELNNLFKQKGRDEWVALLRKHDVCCEPVWDSEEVFSDPQHLARHSFVEIPSGSPSHSIKVPRAPFVFAGEEEEISFPPSAPKLGEHNFSLKVKA